VLINPLKSPRFYLLVYLFKSISPTLTTSPAPTVRTKSPDSTLDAK